MNEEQTKPRAGIAKTVDWADGSGWTHDPSGMHVLTFPTKQERERWERIIEACTDDVGAIQRMYNRFKELLYEVDGKYWEEGDGAILEGVSKFLLDRRPPA